ncbi:MAG: DegT/DnrJ/EryC1/StrS family aminotransferase [Rhodocyclaceae bacterium]|nr:DegT/DnrJ/EryC1/StrS family aminotransferase [Rhodocyclaceae bacterium]
MSEAGSFPLEADRRIRFYSLARYAFVQALQLGGVVTGQQVLLPSFLCRDMLASLASLQVAPVWYAVDERFQPVDAPDIWPPAVAVLAVNYFGFPQDLTPFRAYAVRTGAILIEDNAHGFLSQDAEGNWLGSRAPFGLLSMRKTLRIPDGAALLVNDSQGQDRLPPQLPFNGPGLNLAQLHKARMRCIPLVGDALLKTSTVLARRMRKFRTGSELPQADTHSELELPKGANPWSGLNDAWRNLDVDTEIRRRRHAYAECAEVAAKSGVDPVFKELPEHCAPYGFPFRSDAAGRRIMQDFADRHGFDLVNWPDLPGQIITQAPMHYRNVFLVNFLW